MATATPSVSVRGQGTCTYQPVTPVTEVIQLSSYSYREITLYPYVFTATPANGWVFDHFDVSVEQIWGSGSVVHDNQRRLVNPFALRDYVDPTTSPANWNAVSWLGEWTTVNTAAHTSDHSYYSKYEITAVFVRAKTHLLVNSSTVETPAKLVYDPTTNLLVADF